MGRVAIALWIWALSACTQTAVQLSPEVVSSEEAAEICEDWCDHALSCRWEGDQGDCEARCFGRSDVTRGDAFRSLATCFDDLECGEDPDVCGERAHNSFEPLEFHEEAASGCESRLAECGMSDLAPAVCAADRLELLAEPTTADVSACALRECDAVAACVDALVASAEW